MLVPLPPLLRLFLSLSSFLSLSLSLFFIAIVFMPVRIGEIKVFVLRDEFCSTLVNGDDRKGFEPSVFTGRFRGSLSVLPSTLFILDCFTRRFFFILLRRASFSAGRGMLMGTCLLARVYF